MSGSWPTALRCCPCTSRGGLSETVRQAEAGKALVGRGEIEIIDSRVVSMACGLPAIVAARAAAGGAGLPELVSRGQGVGVTDQQGPALPHRILVGKAFQGRFARAPSSIALTPYPFSLPVRLSAGWWHSCAESR